MTLRRDMFIVLFALGVAGSLYVVSFRDLMAAAPSMVGASPFEQFQRGVGTIIPTAPARAV
jgi:hypothetical protein